MQPSLTDARSLKRVKFLKLDDVKEIRIYLCSLNYYMVLALAHKSEHLVCVILFGMYQRICTYEKTDSHWLPFLPQVQFHHMVTVGKR